MFLSLVKALFINSATFLISTLKLDVLFQSGNQPELLKGVGLDRARCSFRFFKSVLVRVKWAKEHVKFALSSLKPGLGEGRKP